jgi:hypothetical protein
MIPTVPNSGLRPREIVNDTEELIRFCSGIVKRMSFLPGQRT